MGWVINAVLIPEMLKFSFGEIWKNERSFWFSAIKVWKKVSLNTTQPKANVTAAKINPAIIFSRTCPANILANNLIPRLKGLERKDNNSMGTNKGASVGGDPDGKNKLKKFTSCLFSPIKIEPKKTVQDSKKVIKTWLVIAYPKGTIPNRLHMSTKLNNRKIKGK